jgi:hypothetical protein
MLPQIQAHRCLTIAHMTHIMQSPVTSAANLPPPYVEIYFHPS